MAPYSVIGLEIVDLFLEHNGPEIFAEELYNVKIVREAWAVSRKTVGQLSVSCYQTIE